MLEMTRSAPDDWLLKLCQSQCSGQITMVAFLSSCHAVRFRDGSSSLKWVPVNMHAGEPKIITSHLSSLLQLYFSPRATERVCWKSVILVENHSRVPGLESYLNMRNPFKFSAITHVRCYSAYLFSFFHELTSRVKCMSRKVRCGT